MNERICAFNPQQVQIMSRRQIKRIFKLKKVTLQNEGTAHEQGVPVFSAPSQSGT